MPYENPTVIQIKSVQWGKKEFNLKCQDKGLILIDIASVWNTCSTNLSDHTTILQIAPSLKLQRQLICEYLD